MVARPACIVRRMRNYTDVTKARRVLANLHGTGLHGRVALTVAGSIFAVIALIGWQTAVSAQAPAAVSETAQSDAAFDLTGNWVSVVTEDWRFRMVTPPKGDYASVPLNPEGTKVADAWSPSMDGQCEAYGMAGLLRLPTRLRISWQDPQSLRIETDAGVQTRLLHFEQGTSVPAERSLQGFTRAEWERPGGRGRNGGPAAAGGRRPLAPGGVMKATTTMLRQGWLRKNGVPYSADAEVTEYFDLFSLPNGDTWFSVTAIVRDPKYLRQDFVTSVHFKKEVDGSKWRPTPCIAS